MTQSKNKFLVFCDVYKGTLDPYRGVELPADTQMVKYLTGAVALAKSPQPERLRFYFDHLNSPEIEIALDAYREYAKADYKDYKDMAKKLPVKTLVGWLEDPKTPPYRYGLYASLLGHCGGPEQAKLLKKMIEDPEKRRGSGVDGMMAGMVMIEPKEGWAYLSDLMLNEKQDFTLRYSVFRTARFLWDNRPDLVPRHAGQERRRPDPGRRYVGFRDRRAAQVETLGIHRADSEAVRQEDPRPVSDQAGDLAIHVAVARAERQGVRRGPTQTRRRVGSRHGRVVEAGNPGAMRASRSRRKTT